MILKKKKKKKKDWDSIILDDINQVCNEITNKILDSASEYIPNKVINYRPSDPRGCTMQSAKQ